MRHYYIIAGTLDEAMEWAKFNGAKLIDRKGLYVSDPSQIEDRGPDGIFIGSWRTRPDIHEIFLRLTNKTPYGTDKLTKIINLWDSIKNDIKMVHTYNGYGHHVTVKSGNTTMTFINGILQPYDKI